MFTLAEIFEFIWLVELGTYRTDSKPIDDLAQEDI